ncbi:MAG: type VI secretion system baseplate subunit TssF [Candidatus Eisenbacteria bacterium]|nr:type VI secretion system baseplate subunit TssF [Candidatus Eisenbacteria bacterium]
MRSSYYDEELDYIRRLAQEFGASHQEAAHLVEPGQDPDVERLLEGFAFLAAQVRQTLDDDFPELTHGMFNLLWPNFLRAVPSLAIEQFRPKPGAVRGSVKVPRGSQVCSEDSSAALKYRFRTCWDVMLHPIELDSAALEVMRNGESSLVLQFSLMASAKIDSLDLSSLRLYLHEDSRHSRLLYHHLLRHVKEATAWGDQDETPVSVRVAPVGFAREDAVLPYPDGVPPGYRLLQEYFVFPQKFGFVDLTGLEKLDPTQVKSRFSVRLVFDTEPSQAMRVGKGDIRLFCTPVINLFAHSSEPLTLDGTRAHHPIRPQGRDQSRLDVFSVDGMTVRGADRVERPVPWFYSFSPDVFREAPAYFTVRRQLGADHESFQTWVTLVQPDGRSRAMLEGVASFELTCTNGRNVGALDVGMLKGTSDSSPAVASFENITKPTPQVEPPLRIGMLWRLLSLMSANQLAFSSADALRATLELMAAINAGTPSRAEKGFVMGGQDERTTRDVQRRIRGLRAVTPTPVDRLYGGGMIRGTRVTLDVDPDPFEGIGQLFLFGSVLDEYLASHAGINTFTQLHVRYDAGRLPLVWAPRLGREHL